MKAMRFEIWFYNRRRYVTLPVSGKRLEQAAERAGIVSSAIRNENLHVASIRNPELPCRFIQAWSIADMNRFARIAGKIAKTDPDRLSEILAQQPPQSLEDILQVLGKHWPEATAAFR